MWHAIAARRAFITLAAAGFALAGWPLAAHAVGTLADVSVLDRNTGETLPVYSHQGRYYVAGQPGHRYAIRMRNTQGGRLLAVMAVDGVNVVSGETAAWGQTGYVFGAWQSYSVTGWRKSDAQVAAFEFTALPDSYAARTGRAHNVGVIGVALFRERTPEPAVEFSSAEPRAESRNKSAADSTRAAPAAPAAAQSASPMREAQQARGAGLADAPLGTGHGRREGSLVTHTAFERANTQPDEVITLWYDSLPHLIAQGVVPAPTLAERAQPFPGSQPGYVPDPPARWR